MHPTPLTRFAISKSERRLRVIVTWLAALSLLALLWEATGRVLRVRAEVFPTPSRILWEILREWPQIWGALLATLSEAVLGLLGAAIAGCALSLLVSHQAWLGDLVLPLLWIFEKIPAVAAAAFLFVWLGTGAGPKVLLVLVLCAVQIFSQCIRGLNSIHPDLHDLAQAMGLSETQTLLRLRIPTSLPFFFLGMRQAAGLAVAAAALGEYVGADEGLGHLLFQSAIRLNMPLLLASASTLYIAAACLHAAVAAIERRVIPWQPCAPVWKEGPLPQRGGPQAP